MFTLTEILTLFVILIITALFVSYTFIWIFIISPLKRINEEQNRILHTLLRKDQIYGDKLFDISSELSKRFDNLEEELTNDRDNVMPLPQLSEMIEATIREQISIEIALSVKMRLPRKDLVEIITVNVCKTYPFVDKNYIAKKCLALIESTVSKNGE